MGDGPCISPVHCRADFLLSWGWKLKILSEKVALGPLCVLHPQVQVRLCPGALIQLGTEGACPQRPWEPLRPEGRRQVSGKAHSDSEGEVAEFALSGQ